MIQVQTELYVADNTGAKKIECIKVLGGSKRRYASIGDTIVIAVKEAIPKGKVKKGSVHKAVVVRVKKRIKKQRKNENNFIGTRGIIMIKKGLKVKVLAGKDKKKEGEVIEIDRANNRAKVKEINMVKKHIKTTKEKKGGIFSKESFIHISNLKLVDNKKTIKKSEVKK